MKSICCNSYYCLLFVEFVFIVWFMRGYRDSVCMREGLISTVLPYNHYACYDRIWYDMKWYNIIRYDMIWYDMIWYDVIWCDMAWYDMIWYDKIWYDMIWYDNV